MLVISVIVNYRVKEKLRQNNAHAIKSAGR